jgi:hypothetical protein
MTLTYIIISIKYLVLVVRINLIAFPHPQKGAI